MKKQEVQGARRQHTEQLKSSFPKEEGKQLLLLLQWAETKGNLLYELPDLSFDQRTDQQTRAATLLTNGSILHSDMLESCIQFSFYFIFLIHILQQSRRFISQKRIPAKTANLNL